MVIIGVWIMIIIMSFTNLLFFPNDIHVDVITVVRIMIIIVLLTNLITINKQSINKETQWARYVFLLSRQKGIVVPRI